MIKCFYSVCISLTAAFLLSGCVSGETPKSSLTFDSAPLPNSAAGADIAFADLPMEGPTPQDRPTILSMAIGAATDVADPNFMAAGQLAMLEPEKSSETFKPVKTEPSEPTPIIASNRERDCLMRAMYFESNRSSVDGLLSVGTVVMHRLEHGSWGNTICSVVGAKRQFAPGVLSRKMQGDLTDLQLLADQIIAGKRQPKLAKNVMFFHVAGMKFPYKNMRYVHVAGGNTFYYKAQRKRRA